MTGSGVKLLSLTLDPETRQSEVLLLGTILCYVPWCTKMPVIDIAGAVFGCGEDLSSNGIGVA